MRRCWAGGGRSFRFPGGVITTPEGLGELWIRPRREPKAQSCLILGVHLSGGAVSLGWGC